LNARCASIKADRDLTTVRKILLLLPDLCLLSSETADRFAGIRPALSMSVALPGSKQFYDIIEKSRHRDGCRATVVNDRAVEGR